MRGNLSSSLDFDEAFEAWKAGKLANVVIAFSLEWGLDSKLLGKSVDSYSFTQPDVVPYINELISSIDYGKATNQTAGNLLRHNMKLTTKLPAWIAEVKQKYS